jgi:hypothetical protein
MPVLVLHDPWVLLGSQDTHMQPFDETLCLQNALVITDNHVTRVRQMLQRRKHPECSSIGQALHLYSPLRALGTLTSHPFLLIMSCKVGCVVRGC